MRCCLNISSRGLHGTFWVGWTTIFQFLAPSRKYWILLFRELGRCRPLLEREVCSWCTDEKATSAGPRITLFIRMDSLWLSRRRRETEGMMILVVADVTT